MGNCLKSILLIGILISATAPSQGATADGGHLDGIRKTGMVGFGINPGNNPGVEPMEFIRNGQLPGYNIDVGIDVGVEVAGT